MRINIASGVRKILYLPTFDSEVRRSRAVILFNHYTLLCSWINKNIASRCSTFRTTAKTIQLIQRLIKNEYTVKCMIGNYFMPKECLYVHIYYRFIFHDGHSGVVQFNQKLWSNITQCLVNVVVKFYYFLEILHKHLIHETNEYTNFIKETKLCSNFTLATYSSLIQTITHTHCTKNKKNLYQIQLIYPINKLSLHLNWHI